METRKTICIENLPLWVTPQNLKELSSTCGRVLSARIVESTDGLPLGYGFMEMETVDEATQAKQALHDKKRFGVRLRVSTYLCS